MVFDEEHKIYEDNFFDDKNENGSSGNNGDLETQKVAAALEQKCNEELQACTQEVADLKEICKQIAADFENFKKLLCIFQVI